MLVAAQADGASPCRRSTGRPRGYPRTTGRGGQGAHGEQKAKAGSTSLGLGTLGAPLAREGGRRNSRSHVRAVVREGARTMAPAPATREAPAARVPPSTGLRGGAGFAYHVELAGALSTAPTDTKPLAHRAAISQRQAWQRRQTQ